MAIALECAQQEYRWVMLCRAGEILAWCWTWEFWHFKLRLPWQHILLSDDHPSRWRSNLPSWQRLPEGQEGRDKQCPHQRSLLCDTEIRQLPSQCACLHGWRAAGRRLCEPPSPQPSSISHVGSGFCVCIQARTFSSQPAVLPHLLPTREELDLGQCLPCLF